MTTFKETLKFYKQIYENVFTKWDVKLPFVCVAARYPGDEVKFLDNFIFMFP